MKRELVMVMVLVGCDGAHREGHDEVDGGIDAHVPTCSDPGTEIECGEAGCCGDHCCAIAPSNADSIGTLISTGLTIAASGAFDTDTGCTTTSTLGTCSVVARSGLPEACVCRMDELTIGNLDVTGSRALVILAYDNVRIETALDVAADFNRQGPGATTFYTTALPIEGGAGGTFATQGGFGGHGGNVPNPRGNDTLVPLLGGMKGQAGGDEGGGGGGALQITAGTKIEIAGAIYAGGGGGVTGWPSWPTSGAGGGGSGGAILLEAPTVVMKGTLNAEGGGGGGGGGDRGRGGMGNNAADDDSAGGSGYDGSGCPLYGYIVGGRGGNGATSMGAAQSGQLSKYDSRCTGSPAFVGGGGGGGGLGRIRINTFSACECTGTVSPQASFGTLGVQ